MATKFFKVNPAGSYLSVDTPSGTSSPMPSTRVALSDLGLKPGDNISLLAEGDYQAGEYGFDDDGDGLLAVFIGKSGEYIAPPQFRPIFTDAQYTGENTDIAEDFSVGENLLPVTYTVPTDAVALLFSVEDIFYSDNLDPDRDFGVRIYTGNDASVSGADALHAINYESLRAPSDDGFPFFDLINVKPFLTQNWSSQPFFQSTNDTWRVTSAEGSSLELASTYSSRTGYSYESTNLNFKNFFRRYARPAAARRILVEQRHHR